MTLRPIVTVFYACGRCGLLALHAIEQGEEAFICSKCRMVSPLPRDAARKPPPNGRCAVHNQPVDDCSCA